MSRDSNNGLLGCPVDPSQGLGGIAFIQFQSIIRLQDPWEQSLPRLGIQFRCNPLFAWHSVC